MELPPIDLPGMLGPTEAYIIGAPFAAIWLLSGIVSAMVATNKGRSGCSWFLLGFLLGPVGLPKIRQLLSKDWFSAARCSTVPTAPNWSERRRSNAGTVVRISAGTHRRPIRLTCAGPASESQEHGSVPGCTRKGCVPYPFPEFKVEESVRDEPCRNGTLVAHHRSI